MLRWPSSGQTISVKFKVLLLLLTLSWLSATRGQGRGSICSVPGQANLILADGQKGDNVMDKYLRHLECLDLAQLAGSGLGGLHRTCLCKKRASEVKGNLTVEKVMTREKMPVCWGFTWKSSYLKNGGEVLSTINRKEESGRQWVKAFEQETTCFLVLLANSSVVVVFH